MLALVLKPNRLNRNSIGALHYEKIQWLNLWGRNWDKVLDFLKKCRADQHNQRLLEELVDLYQEVDSMAKGKCSRAGLCCTSDFRTTFIEYLHFMTPFLEGSAVLDYLYLKQPLFVGRVQEQYIIYYEPPCTFLEADKVGTKCIAYEYRPLACRAIVPQGFCRCELIKDCENYERKVFDISSQLNVPSFLRRKFKTLTRDWPMTIQIYLFSRDRPLQNH